MKEKLILVDDNIVNLTIGKQVLGEEYDLLTVPSGARLFQALERVRPSLILLDVDMPSMDGFETLRQLKADPAYQAIPVLFLSARDDEASIDRGLRLGAADFITKPYLPQHLAAIVKAHLLLQLQQRTLDTSSQALEKAVLDKRNAIIQLQNAVLSTVVGLAEARGHSRPGHILTSSEALEKPLSALIHQMQGEALYKQELSQWDVDLFMASAHFHDIGKIIVKDNILLKPSRLTPGEYNQMKLHTAYGVRLIESVEKSTVQRGFFTSAKLFASAHHERWDGSGYPLGLRAEEIPLQGRLMAILDVYNALISERPYKRPMTHQKARETIARGRGTLFDPLLTDIFLSLPTLF